MKCWKRVERELGQRKRGVETVSEKMRWKKTKKVKMEHGGRGTVDR